MAWFIRRVALALACVALSPSLHAAEPAGEKFPDAEAPLGVLPTPEDALIDPKMARSWGTLPPRGFAATTVDIGFVYLRPRLSLGYGRPFTKWIGIDANPIAATSGLGAYAGARVEVPYFDFRIGPRYYRSFERTYLPIQKNYARIDLERDVGDTASTLTFEAEIDFSAPLGPGRVLARASGSYATGVPEDRVVFEESLHVIVEPPLVWRARVGYVFTFGARNQHSIGPVVDFLDVVKREDSEIIRVGPIMRMQLSRRVEVRGSFVATVFSPDRLGRVGGDFTELGVRYRWASE